MNGVRRLITYLQPYNASCDPSDRYAHHLLDHRAVYATIVSVLWSMCIIGVIRLPYLPRYRGREFKRSMFQRVCFVPLCKPTGISTYKNQNSNQYSRHHPRLCELNKKLRNNIIKILECLSWEDIVRCHGLDHYLRV